MRLRTLILLCIPLLVLPGPALDAGPSTLRVDEVNLRAARGPGQVDAFADVSGSFLGSRPVAHAKISGYVNIQADTCSWPDPDVPTCLPGKNETITYAAVTDASGKFSVTVGPFSFVAGQSPPPEPTCLELQATAQAQRGGNRYGDRVVTATVCV